MAIVECAAKMNKTAQKPSETTEEYFDIIKAQRNTVNAHDGQAVYHKGMFKKATIKSMDETNKMTFEVYRDPVLKKKIK